jgi:hypothetical protein
MHIEVLQVPELVESIKEHIGFVVGSGVSPLSGHSMNAATAITKIAAAEAAGVRQIWMNQEYLDTLTIFAAAASKRRRVLEPQLCRPIYVTHWLWPSRRWF